MFWPNNLPLDERGTCIPPGAPYFLWQICHRRAVGEDSVWKMGMFVNHGMLNLSGNDLSGHARWSWFEESWNIVESSTPANLGRYFSMFLLWSINEDERSTNMLPKSIQGIRRNGYLESPSVSLGSGSCCHKRCQTCPLMCMFLESELATS